jgi:hypothetical protein
MVVGWVLLYFSCHAVAHWVVGRSLGIRFAFYTVGGTGNPEGWPAGLRWLFEHLPFFGVQTEKASMQKARPIARAITWSAGVTSFFNMVQHHGYPTPLLDWTYSPYVAAFFAYRGITNEQAAKARPTDKVRILVFDQAQWRKDFNQLLQVICPTFHVSFCEFIAIENERMIPQQAASLITNIEDIESYVIAKEAEGGKKYLWAIHMPMSERRHVISELSYMGITAGSMFPGLDGACEELKERNFHM